MARRPRSIVASRLPRRSPRRLVNTGLLALLKDRDARVINFLALASLTIAFLVRVAFASDGSSIPGAADTANLASDLCVGYLAAWAVYYLTTSRPRREDRDRALRAVGPTAISVSGTAGNLLTQLREIAQQPSSGPISERELDALVKDLTTAGPARMVGADMQPVTILQMLWYIMERAQGFIERARTLELYLDGELAVALAAIHDCGFFAHLRLMSGLPGVASLHIFVPGMYEYFLLCDALCELVCERYGEVIDGVNGLSINAVRQNKVANGTLEWKPGSTCPWETTLP
jgi:hypothetical protein